MFVANSLLHFPPRSNNATTCLLLNLENVHNNNKYGDQFNGNAHRAFCVCINNTVNFVNINTVCFLELRVYAKPAFPFNHLSIQNVDKKTAHTSVRSFTLLDIRVPFVLIYLLCDRRASNLYRNDVCTRQQSLSVTTK